MSKRPVLITLDDDTGAQPHLAPAVPDTAGPQERLRCRRSPPSPRGVRRAGEMVLGAFAVVGRFCRIASGLGLSDRAFAALDRAGRHRNGSLCYAFADPCDHRAARTCGLWPVAQARQDPATRSDCLAAADLSAARGVVAEVTALYAARDDTSWGRAALTDRAPEMLDADALLGLAETTVLAPLDARARREVEAAARQVATVTAVVPLALADVFTALTANLRMIRRIAEIYGGRSGTLGSWRLTRSVLSHLVATGAVAVGDDLISSVAGGGMLSKVSRRFGEGVVNGALTARVGIAAMEVCRPLPFQTARKPSVSGLVSRALTGLFGGSDAR